MLTFKEAKELKPGDILLSTIHFNSRGEPQRWKVNGKVKLWKKDPLRIVVPLKHGMYSYDKIDQGDFRRVGLSTNPDDFVCELLRKEG